MKHINKRGFTLIEILLVIALIAILAGIVIVAINPNRQLMQARDTERSADVNTILNAISQYTVDNNGVLPASMTIDGGEICRTGTLAATCTASELIDLSVVTDNETYLVAMPIDPSCELSSGGCDPNGTGYNVQLTVGGRVQVEAAEAEISSITVTR